MSARVTWAILLIRHCRAPLLHGGRSRESGEGWQVVNKVVNGLSMTSKGPTRTFVRKLNPELTGQNEDWDSNTAAFLLPGLSEGFHGQR